MEILKWINGTNGSEKTRKSVRPMEHECTDFIDHIQPELGEGREKFER